MNNKVFVQINDLFWIKGLVRKKLYIDGKLAQTFRGNETQITSDGTSFRLKIEIIGGLFSSECIVPQSESNVVVEFRNKSVVSIQLLLTFVCLYAIADVVCFHFIAARTLLITLWCVLLFVVVYIIAKRKKRYDVIIRQ